MTDQLLKEVFKKAEKETEKVSANGRAEFIADSILTEFKYQISAKSLIRYFKGESNPSMQTKNFLAQFLGFENYDSYIVHYSSSNDELAGDKHQPKFKVPKKSIFATLLLVPIIGISAFLGYSSGEKKCMVWEEVRYIETSCTGSDLEQNFIPYVFENFKKIEVTDTTTFFKNGEVQIWYDKSNNQLEFFTAPGIHPENGKTLKPITNYMIGKYIH